MFLYNYDQGVFTIHIRLIPLDEAGQFVTNYFMQGTWNLEQRKIKSKCQIIYWQKDVQP